MKIFRALPGRKSWRAQAEALKIQFPEGTNKYG